MGNPMSLIPLFVESYEGVGYCSAIQHISRIIYFGCRKFSDGGYSIHVTPDGRTLTIAIEGYQDLVTCVAPENFT